MFHPPQPPPDCVPCVHQRRSDKCSAHFFISNIRSDKSFFRFPREALPKICYKKSFLKSQNILYPLTYHKLIWSLTITSPALNTVNTWLNDILACYSQIMTIKTMILTFSTTFKFTRSWGLTVVISAFIVILKTDSISELQVWGQSLLVMPVCSKLHLVNNIFKKRKL